MNRFFGWEILHDEDRDEMQEVCRLAAQTLSWVGSQLEPGMTTDAINDLVHTHTLSLGCSPAPLQYRGFPKSVCVSVNEVVCHGIPGPRVLQDGDIVNVDVTHRRNGFYGDTSATFEIGSVSEEARQLVRVTRECLERAIAVVRPGARIGEIGAIIEDHAEAHGYSVVRAFTGHGIGRRFHAEPGIPHYRRGRGPEMVSGMCFTIEPMLNLGDAAVEVLEDRWTAVTADRSLSAQFEHTIRVTEEGCEVLTIP